MAKLFRVAILGTGNIGTDLLYKVRRSPVLKCSYFVGRRVDSPGLQRAREMGILALSGGMDELESHLENIDLVFDATSARDHLIHADILAAANCHVVNLTPASVGDFYVPGVSTLEISTSSKAVNMNMVTCGGQTAIPVISAVKKAYDNLASVEIVSTLSSSSAGPATRRNIDEYIQNTERAIIRLTALESAKAMLVLNPAKPEIMMHTSLYFRGSNVDINLVSTQLARVVSDMQIFCPGFEISSQPRLLHDDVLHLAVSVTGAGDYLPKHAGNLDIINVAAIRAAEELASND